MHDGPNEVTGGVDIHTDAHVAAVVDGIGGILATASFDTTTAGYRDLLRWISSFGQLVRVAVEGTGAYGAGLCARPDAPRSRRAPRRRTNCGR